MEEASAMSSTLHKFFISVVNFNTAFFSCQKKIPFFSVFLHKNTRLQAAVSKTAVFSFTDCQGAPGTRTGGLSVLSFCWNFQSHSFPLESFHSMMASFIALVASCHVVVTPSTFVVVAV